MEQNIYFKNKEDLKRKVCELINNCIDFKVTENCITFEIADNVIITYMTKTGLKTKKIFVEGYFLNDIVKNLYAKYDIDVLVGEPCRITGIEKIEK